MLTVLKGEAGQLQAACDWWLVDALGHWHPLGQYVYLNQLEVSPGVNLHRVRRHLVQEIGRLAPYATGVYWERRDSFNTKLRSFRREQLQQLTQEEVRV
mgnify:CR=1 FL=1